VSDREIAVYPGAVEKAGSACSHNEDTTMLSMPDISVADTTAARELRCLGDAMYAFGLVGREKPSSD
jgi:hypothetical protein